MLILRIFITLITPIIAMSLFKLKHLWIDSLPGQQFDEHHLAIALALGSFKGSLQVYLIHANPELAVSIIYQTVFDSPIIGVEFVNHPEYTRNTVGVLIFRKFYYITLNKNRETNNYEGRSTQIQVEPAFAIEPQTLSLMTINSTIQYLNPPSLQSIKVADPIYPFVRQEQTLYYADGEELVMVRNSVEQWRIIVGPMRNLYIWKNLVIALGENALWSIQESHIANTKSMEEEISFGRVIDKGADYNIIVANFANQILIYNSSFTLLWAIKANQVPIKICIFQHQSILGALAFLGEEGTVSISYLGSEVSETSMQTLNQDINLIEVEAETTKLLAALKNKQEGSNENGEKSQSANTGSLKLSLVARPPRKGQFPSIDNDNSFYRIDGELWCCEVECNLRSDKQTLYEVSVNLRTPSNITCINNDGKFASLRGTQRHDFILLCSSEKFAYDSQVEVLVRYESGELKKGMNIACARCELPLDFQCSFKNSELEEKPANKIVLKAHENLPAFSQIFREFQNQLGNSKNMTIELPNGVRCSMGYNKNNTKVKIESSLFSGLCFMFVVFTSRFEGLVQSKKIASNQLSIDDIPLQEFFTLMKDHFGLRSALKQRTEQLEKKCEEFRNAEKKLIIKMKEKVSSINNIDKLLQYTYKKLIEAADALEHTRDEMDSVSHNLEISIKFVMELLFLKTKATPKCRSKVQGIIGYEKECLDYGWEEKILSNSSHLLNKKFNYTLDKYTFDQLYKTALWVISKINSGEWNE